MDLVSYTDADRALTETLECDPATMAELGGPVDPAEIPAIHRRRLETVAGGDWWFTIVPEPPGPPAGVIGIWPKAWAQTEGHEVGWMVLPAFRGRGVATRALDLLLSRARCDPRFERLHAFPSLTNEASNGLCRRFGFTEMGECDVEYAGRPLRCRHWQLTLERECPDS